MRKMRLSAAVGLALGLGACTTVNPVSYPAEYISMRTPSDIWITQADNPKYAELRNPQLHGDTLAGFDKEGHYIELPVESVQLMKAKAFSPTKTAIFASVAAVGSAAALLAVTGTNGPANVCFYPASSTGIPGVCGEFGPR
jgi:hypothetical protein